MLRPFFAAGLAFVSKGAIFPQQRITLHSSPMPSTVSRRILAYNAGRLPQVLSRKYQKMAADAFSFYRGTAHLFYEDLAAAPPLPASPAAWLCGDLHPENFGSYKGDNRQVYFDISDFDEGLLGPALLDVLRMATGVCVAFKTLNFAGPQDAVRHFLNAYAATLAGGKDLRIETATATGVVKDLLEKVGRRKREKWLDKRTKERDGELRFKEIEGKQLRLTDEALREDLLQHLNGHSVCQGGEGRRFRALDVCFRLAGTGSLGLKRYLFLLEATGAEHKHYLLDMKQAHPSCLAPYVQTPQPPWASEAERTVAVEDRMLAVDKALLTTTVFRGEAYKVEEMQPTEDKVALEDVTGAKDLFGLLADAGVLTASAQLRSAGRNGSAVADDLIELGGSQAWQQAVLDYALGYAETAQNNYERFAEDLRQGLFEEK